MKAFLIGTPKHSNIGDHAITIAELNFLKDCGLEDITEIVAFDFSYREKVNRDSLIFLHGGGNMGDEYYWEEEYRRQILKDLKDNKIFIFPQTIYYKDKNKEKDSIIFYNRSNITICARGEISFFKMKELYPLAQIILCPDITLWDKNFYCNSNKEIDILFCLRQDKEKNINLNIDNFFNSDLNKIIIDNHCHGITLENREIIVKNQIKNFSKAKLIVTDRLHGFIFGLYSAAAVILIDNYNYKIQENYNFLKGYNFIRKIEEFNQLNKTIEELLIEKNVFDNSILLPYFKKLKSEIKLWL